MELLGGYLLFAALLWLTLVLSPFLFLWLAYRAVRHLYHIEVALFQIRDTLRTQEPVVSLPESHHVANSMFGR